MVVPLVARSIQVRAGSLNISEREINHRLCTLSSLSNAFCFLIDDPRSICYGMVFGFVYLNAQKHGVIDDSTRQNLLNKGRAAVPLVAGALLAFAGYTAFTLTCRNKPECNAVHSYAAFVPVITLIKFLFTRTISSARRFSDRELRGAAQRARTNQSALLVVLRVVRPHLARALHW